jgi:hypothetical protein
MSQESLQAIVGTAILDKQFLHDLLNSRREQAISKFELTPEERRVLGAIRAETIEQFAYQLDDWIVGQEKKAFTTKAPSAFRYTYDPASLSA